jgi:uncharacterized protein (DUF433 family)
VTFADLATEEAVFTALIRDDPLHCWEVEFLPFGGPRMAEAVKTEHPHIVRLEGVCGGEPLIDGLRVTVRHVAVLHRRGETILEIAEALGITEAQVFHALSYFLDHTDEILALVAREEQAHARFRLALK